MNPTSLPVLRTLSDLAARAGLALRAGLTFGGARDLFEALGYQRVLKSTDFRSRYRRGDIAGRIIDAYPRATWRDGAELIEDENPEISTAFELEWEALQTRFRIWSVLARADILAGLGEYAVLLLGVPGLLEEPAGVSGPGSLMFLQPLEQSEVMLEELDEREDSPRFGMPMFYKLRRKTALGTTISRRVHYSRVIHVADGILDDPLVGTPRLERVWNRLDDLDKVAGGGSEAFWQRVHQGMVFSVDPTTEIDEPGLTKMKEEAERFAHGMKRTIAMRGATVEALGTDVSNFAAQVSTLISLISGATGIPQRILLGSERGELASSQDKENWDTRVADRRSDFAEPQVVRPLVDRLISFGILPAPRKYDVRWPKLQDLTPTEQAAIADTLSKINGQIGEVVVTGAEIRDRVLGLDPLDQALLLPAPAPAPTPGVPALPAAPVPALAAARAAASTRPKAQAVSALLRRFRSIGLPTATPRSSEGS